MRSQSSIDPSLVKIGMEVIAITNGTTIFIALASVMIVKPLNQILVLHSISICMKGKYSIALSKIHYLYYLNAVLKITKCAGMIDGLGAEMIFIAI